MSKGPGVVWRAARATLLAVLVGSIVVPSGATAQVPSLRIYVVDRGQADGIVIRTPNGKWIVIDGGTNAQQAKYMRDELGISRIALAAVSHRHRDHLGGMDEIIKAVPVDRFVGDMGDCPGYASDDQVRVALAAGGTEILPVEFKTHQIDGVKLTVFSRPPPSDCPDGENDNSVIIRLDYGEFSMLLLGDAQNDELGWLMAHHLSLLDVDVLKASHHGATNGFTDDFLKAVSPTRVVISAGVNGTYKHPHKKAVDAYIAAVGKEKIYCTNRRGSITISGYESGQVRVKTQRQSTKSCVYDGIHY